MLTITRRLARELRAVFRRAGIPKTYGGYSSRAWLLADGNALRIRALGPETAVEYQMAQNADPVNALVPLDLLAACEGNRTALTTVLGSFGSSGSSAPSACAQAA